MAGKKNPLTPFDEFLGPATVGSFLLVGATAIAMAAAAWFGADALHHLWDRELAIVSGGRFRLSLSLHEWVNDALMALFFLLVGLELKRAILVGELSTVRDATLPVAAALGGMLIPALVYLAFNAGTASARGWGIPMATDIAFAVGMVALLGARVPRNLVVFLTALAIADDLGAVAVIATFYTPGLDHGALRACAALFVLLVLFNRGGVRHPLPYAIVGVLLWYYVLLSGVHPTIAGVLLAATIPARPTATPDHFQRRLDELAEGLRADRQDASTPDDPLRNARMASIAMATERAGAAVQSPLQRIEHALGPWVSFLVVPVFALANAGIDVSSFRWGEALSNGITLGVMAGLVVGKFAGISLFSWLAVKMGVGRLPAGVAWRHLLGAAWLAGIGFTMSIFISQLAFVQAEQLEAARLGILIASCVAGAVGFVWLWTASRR